MISSGLMFVGLQKKQDPHLGTAEKFYHFEKSTAANKWIFKEVVKRLISTSIVRHSNTIMTYIFGNHCGVWTRPTTSFLIIIIFLSLVLSISPTFSVTKNPTPIFILTHLASFLSFIIITTGKLIVNLGGGVAIAVEISKQTVGFFL